MLGDEEREGKWGRGGINKIENEKRIEDMK